MRFGALPEKKSIAFLNHCHIVTIGGKCGECHSGRGSEEEQEWLGNIDRDHSECCSQRSKQLARVW